jgi:hypothetical protein
MKYQINWQLLDLSSNYLLKKKIDNCVILYDDKDYVLVTIKYFKKLLFTTYHMEDVYAEDMEVIFKSQIEENLQSLINYSEYKLAPIYFSEGEMGCQIINIGIFILDGFSIKKSNESIIGKDFRQCFMSVIKHGIEATNTNVEELRKERYPELKSEIDDILYIKQAGFYFNLLKSLYQTCQKSINKTYIEVPICSQNDIRLIDITELLETAYPHWIKWQIIWRSNKYAITQYFKGKKWNSESNITDNISKKYRNIIFNQSLMSENKVLNSLSASVFKPIKTVTKNKKGFKNTLKKTDIDTTIEKMSNINICGKKYNFELQLKKYSKFSGSKHLHYLQKEKIKELSISEMLKDLKF